MAKIIESFPPLLEMKFKSDMLAPYTRSRFYDKIERILKFEISQMFFENQNRLPTKEEYENYFLEALRNVKCNVTNYDLGIFEE